MAKDAKAEFTVDLENKTIAVAGKKTAFSIAEPLRQKLLEGLDDIGWTLQFDQEIAAYEKTFVAGIKAG